MKLRVKLITDLTQYDKRCKAGELGYTGNPKSMWARSADRFVGIDFDNGAELDVLWKSLEVVKN